MKNNGLEDSVMTVEEIRSGVESRGTGTFFAYVLKVLNADLSMIINGKFITKIEMKYEIKLPIILHFLNMLIYFIYFKFSLVPFYMFLNVFPKVILSHLLHGV